MNQVLAWLRRLFRRPDEREIFAYWDGVKQRRIDPLAAWRAIWADEGCDFGSDFKVALNPQKADGTAFYPDALVDEAEQKLLAMIRRVFGVKAWTEQSPGLTVNETMDLLVQYMTYRTELKKKRSNSPTPSPYSDSREEPDSADSAPTESQPTTEPDCGCTGSASIAAELSGQSKPSAAL